MPITLTKSSHRCSQAERDQGRRPGLTTAERERLEELERENREPRRANEVLRRASACFAQAEQPLDFLRRLAALIPAPYAHTIRYHGIFAHRARSRQHRPPGTPRSWRTPRGGQAAPGATMGYSPTPTWTIPRVGRIRPLIRPRSGRSPARPATRSLTRATTKRSCCPESRT